ncbi:MAG: hypothetical protein Q9160_006256 [Pyrenula sp. 1 TL-2023]
MAVNGTTASPGLRPTPGGQLDPTRQAEYPIRLGSKLSGKNNSRDNRFVAVRYNYRPKHTLNQKSKVVKAPSSATALNLTLEDTPNDTSGPITYKYSGSVDPKSKTSEKHLTALALVFDSSRNEFVAEPVTSELNFNITSGPGQKARSRAQLDTIGDTSPEHGSEQEDDGLFGGNGDANDAGPPDKSNPFDYRHFLEQTKKEAAAAAAAASNTVATPSMTPLSDFGGASSPVPRKPNFGSKPKPKIPTSHSSNKPTPPSSSTSNLKSKPPRSHPLTTSNNNNNTTKPQTKKLSRPAAAARPSSPSSSSPSPPRAPLRSPNIVVSSAPPHHTDTASDPASDADDLVIDMGSPPPQRRRLHQLDPSAFASASHSPDVRMHNAGDGDGEKDGDRDADSDVESLVLGSPNEEAVAAITSKRGKRREGEVVGLGVTNAGTAGERDDEDEDEDNEEEEEEERGDRGTGDDVGGGGAADEEDEIDEDIMKQMEDVLEDDEDMEDVGVAVHAHVPARMQIEEEESEVSEEE